MKTSAALQLIPNRNHAFRVLGKMHRRPQRADEPSGAETQDGSRTGVVVFSSPRQVLVETPTAARLLQDYLPTSKSKSHLPAFLEEWLSDAEKTTTRNLAIEGGDRRLVITLLGKADLSILILTEQRKPMTPERLYEVGLTHREAEVMSLVIQGKTNWEIARILETSQRTVDKHMEHILEKLGAENRTTAIRIAMERCGY